MLRFSQERVVAAITLATALGAAVALPGFASAENLGTVLRMVAVLGVLTLGMSLVIIGRGIDLSVVSIMAMTVAIYLQLLANGWSDGAALATTFAAVIGLGGLNGVLVAYADMPAIIVTLACGSFTFGVVRSQIIYQDAVSVPPGHWLIGLGQTQPFGLPIEVVIFALLCAVVHLFLNYTRWGRFIYLAGDNPLAARTSGLPVRPMLVLRHVISAILALLAGLLTAANLQLINTRVVNSSLLYDVILVAVIGGVGLSGGKGGVRNILLGLALIGTLMNAMTILDLSQLTQNLIKSLILLFAIILDGVLNPRDEQTAQQGDI